MASALLKTIIIRSKYFSISGWLILHNQLLLFKYGRRLPITAKIFSLLQLIQRKRGSKRHSSSAVLFELEKIAEISNVLRR